MKIDWDQGPEEVKNWATKYKDHLIKKRFQLHNERLNSKFSISIYLKANYF